MSEEDTPEVLEKERLAAQEFIDQGVLEPLFFLCGSFERRCLFFSSSIAEPLDDDDLERKEEYIKQGFPDWSRRDFQQLVRGLETYGWSVLPFPFLSFFG